MSEELKNQVFKQRIGELVSDYEDRMANLRVANTMFKQEIDRKNETIAGLEEQIRVMEESNNVAEPQEAPAEPAKRED